ncbi:hypothetical protein [Sphingobium sp. EM0848]|uniref:hypothetical protein n=1 Tax=Sphingobium sp. EM0848 TaxID=2743473 RepID=UPI0021013A33|nr:hypothetical protein [Sphingobium sp. EM0848]
MVHGATWPWSNGFIRSLPRPKKNFHYTPANDLQACAARLPTTGKIIAELKFAFWENIFTVGQETRIWNKYFRTCFPGAPTQQTISQCRLVAYSDLRAIRHLRNRIAHHEPVFTRNIADDYQRIHDMIAWRSPVAAAWMDGKQTVLGLLGARPQP